MDSGKALLWGLGGLIVGKALWNALPQETKNQINAFLNQFAQEMAASRRRQEELEQQRLAQQLLASFPSPMSQPIFDVNWLLKAPLAAQKHPQLPTSQPVVVPALTTAVLESDARWRSVIIHPSVVLVLGKRGSGKSALGYRLLELCRYVAKPFVVGVPSSARSLLPDWIGIAPTLEDLPAKSIALVDEAYLLYHARGSMARGSRAMSQALNLSRQKEQTLIFVSQEARQVDKNIASSANVVIFKDLGILQLEFDRPELNKLANQAKEALNTVTGDRRSWAFTYAPDSDFRGLLKNELPTFWKPSLGHLFAAGAPPARPRESTNVTSKDKALRAKELREAGASYSEIAQSLGVTRGTVVNYLKGYPYQTKSGR